MSTNELIPLDKAIENFKEVLRYIEKCTTDWVEIKINIGDACIEYYKITRNSVYFNEAIKHFEEVVECLKEGSLIWKSIKLKIAKAYLSKIEHKNDTCVITKNSLIGISITTAESVLKMTYSSRDWENIIPGSVPKRLREKDIVEFLENALKKEK